MTPLPVPSGGQSATDPGAPLRRILAAALAAVHPGPVTAVTLGRLFAGERPTGVHLLALGKGAHAMAEAAVRALAELEIEPAGGIVVAHHDAPPPHPALAVAVGDHPYPKDRSLDAAERLGATVAAVGPGDTAIVLLSGGTSSLVGAPVDGVTPDELRELSRTLLGAGADIGFVNAVRRRVARWGAGRLAVALAPARTVCLVLSDVPGYPPALVGSGPCAADPLSAAEIVDRIRAVGVWDAIPAGVRERLVAGASDVPPPDHPAFARVTLELLADNGTACDAAAEAARAEGFVAVRHAVPLAGEASALAAPLVAALLEAPAGTVHVWGGEPAVTLDGAPSDAAGGRMQELALAAARALQGHADAVLLASGTDGRDGPSDASGAIVDGGTWHRIARAGRDPADDLATHRSHQAHSAVDSLLPAAPTGTNVADLVLALRR